MADYRYVGFTAYVADNPENKERFRVLLEALDGLQGNVEGVSLSDDVSENYMSILKTEPFETVYALDYMTYPDSSELPNDTPEQYERPNIQNVTIKGQNLARIYVPSITKRQYEDQDNFILNGLFPLTQSLFGQDLLNAQIKKAYENDDFQAIPSKIIKGVAN